MQSQTKSFPSLSLDQLLELDLLCDGIRDQIANNVPFNLEQCLEENDEFDPQILFKYLLPFEIDQRRKTGQNDEEIRAALVGRYPEQEATIDHVLANTSRMGSLLTGSYPSGISTFDAWIPKEIGPYKVLGLLNHGGMGVVLKIHDTARNCVEAIKLIKPDLLQNLSAEDQVELRERFLQEARAISNLHHPHIIRVLEVGSLELGELKGVPFYRMEFIEGQSLSEKLSSMPGHRLDCREAARIMAEVADALAHAHAAGIIHRDLKPSNILLDHANQPYLIDFGLAKWKDRSDVRTKTGTSGMGTLPYMSPEQIQDAANVKEASDLFSMGSILYELVSGSRAFPAREAVRLMQQILHEEPISAQQLNSSVDQNIATIIERCLVKAPGQRYESAKHLCIDLRRYLNHEPIHARRIRWWEHLYLWSLRRPALALLTALTTILAIIALTAVIVGYIQTSDALVAMTDAKNRAEDSFKEANVERVKAEKARTKSEQLAAEKTQMLAAMTKQHGASLYELGNAQALLYFNEAFQTDSRPETGNDLRLMAALQQFPKLEQMFFLKSPAYFAEMSPDGKKVAVACRNGQVQMFDTKNGQQSGSIIRHPDAVTCVIFSPDGQQIATACENETVRVWHTASGKPVTDAFKLGCPILDISFSPDGKRVLASGGHPHRTILQKGHVVKIDYIRVGNRKIPVVKKGPPIFVTPRGRAMIWDIATGQPLFSPIIQSGWITHSESNSDGTLVVTSAGTSLGKGSIQVWDAFSGKELHPDGFRHDNLVNHARFSPNGKYLLTGSGDFRSGLGQAQLWDVKTGKSIGPSLRHGDKVVHVCFRPDGQMFATASADQTVRLWNMPNNEENLDQFSILKLGAPLKSVEFTPNSRYLLTVTTNHEVSLFDSQTGQRVIPALKHQSPILSAQLDQSGQHVVTACQDGTVRIWDLSPTLAPTKQRPFDQQTNVVCHSLSGKYLLVASGRVSTVTTVGGSRSFIRQAIANDTLHVLDSETGQTIVANIPHIMHDRPASLAMAFSPNEKQLVSITEELKGDKRQWYVAEIRDIPSGVVQHRFRTKQRILQVYFTFAGDCHALLESEANRLQIWDVVTQRPLKPSFNHDNTMEHGLLAMGATPAHALVSAILLKEPADQIAKSFFDPLSGYLATVTKNHVLRVWDINSRKLQGVVSLGNDDVSQIVFHKMTGKMAIVSNRYSGVQLPQSFLQIWDLDRWQRTSTTLAHYDDVNFATFDRTGNKIVTCSNDGTARVWQTSNGKPVAKPMVHQRNVNHADFSPDGTRIATVCDDQSARVWHVASGEPLTSALHHPFVPFHCQFAGHGKTLVTVAADIHPANKQDTVGLLRYWDLGVEQHSPTELQTLCELLTGYQLAPDDNSGITNRMVIPLSTHELQQRWRRLNHH